MNKGVSRLEGSYARARSNSAASSLWVSFPTTCASDSRDSTPACPPQIMPVNDCILGTKLLHTWTKLSHEWTKLLHNLTQLLNGWGELLHNWIKLQHNWAKLLHNGKLLGELPNHMRFRQPRHPRLLTPNHAGK